MKKRKLVHIGERFGRLIVENGPERVNGLVRWKCRCDCGATKSVQTAKLNSGETQSCGCLQRERASTANLIHGATAGKRSNKDRPSEYKIWVGIRERCNNPNNHAWKYYGGRGISVCDDWDNFSSFLSDMGSRPGPEYSIDRYPNPDGNYEPGNCRWATWVEQNNNKTRIARADQNGVKLTEVRKGE